MVDRMFADPRLAAIYDWAYPTDAAHDYYLDMARRLPPARILDMGCGTGRLACALAGLGHRVTGADPAAGMLAVARARTDGGAVAWVEATAAQLDLDRRFDLVVMTGHVFQVFLDADEAVAALANLRRHLAPGGRIAFETRNPARREWESWIPAMSTETVSVPGMGAVTVFNAIVAVDLPLVTFLTHYVFPDGEEVATPSTLRFTAHRDLVRLLDRAGLAVVACYGDWDRRDFAPDAPEIVVTAASRAANA